MPSMMSQYRSWSKSFNSRRRRGSFSGTSSPRRRRSRRRNPKTGLISPLD